MRLMGRVRAIAVAGMFAGFLLATVPAGAIWSDAGLAQHRAESVQAAADERGTVTLGVSVAILALGSLWLVLVARRIQPRRTMDGIGG